MTERDIRCILRKMGLNASVKSINPCKPAQSAQADIGRNFLLFVNYFFVKAPFNAPDPVSCPTKKG